MRIIKLISEIKFCKIVKKRRPPYLVPSSPLRVVEVGQVNLLEGLKKRKIYNQLFFFTKIFNFLSVFQVRSFVSPGKSSWLSESGFDRKNIFFFRIRIRPGMLPVFLLRRIWPSFLPRFIDRKILSGSGS